MHKDEVEIFLSRAKNFLEGAKERFQKDDWDLSCFMAEQSVQLFTKAIILEKGGEFPKTHSIRKLLASLYQLTKNENFKYDRKSLLFLENAYLKAFSTRWKIEEEKVVALTKKYEALARAKAKAGYSGSVLAQATSQANQNASAPEFDTRQTSQVSSNSVNIYWDITNNNQGDLDQFTENINSQLNN